MIEIVWRLEHEVLDREQVMGPLLDGICRMPGFEAAFYDVNGRDQWRGYDRVHAVVDALTQRTQWLRIANAGRTSLAMVAMGKHGEVPTMMMQLGDWGLDRLDELTVGWDTVFEEVGVVFGSLSSAAWRASLVSEGIGGEGCEGMEMIQVLGEGASGALLKIIDECGAMRRYRRGSLDVLVLGDREQVVDDEHAVALRKVCALLVR